MRAILAQFGHERVNARVPSFGVCATQGRENGNSK